MKILYLYTELSPSVIAVINGSSGIFWGFFIGLFEEPEKQNKKLLEWKG